MGAHPDFSLFLPDSVYILKFSGLTMCWSFRPQAFIPLSDICSRARDCYDYEPFFRPASQGMRGGRWSGGLPPRMILPSITTRKMNSDSLMAWFLCWDAGGFTEC